MSADGAPREESLPLARSADLVVRLVGDETLVYDLRRHRAYCLNPPAAHVWRRCDGTRTVGELASLPDLETGESMLRRDLAWYALGRLGRASLLDAAPAVPAEHARLTRRTLVRRALAAGASAAVVPGILSLLAPTALQAQASCRPQGAPCLLNNQCCSGRCGLMGLELVCLPPLGAAARSSVGHRRTRPPRSAP